MAYNRSKFPEEYDIFEEKFDLPSSEAGNAKRYQELFAKGSNKTEDETIEFNELKDRLSEFILTPEDINYYQDAMTNVQKFFVENTSGYIDDLKGDTKEYTDKKKKEMQDYTNLKQDEMEEYIDDKKDEIEDRQDETINYISQFKYIGVYQNDRQYKRFNTVKFRGNMYFATKDTKGNDPTDIRYWVKIADNGDKVNWRGTWSPVTHYKQLDMVRYDGSVYVCEVDNSDKVPATSTNYWRIVIDGRDNNVSGYYENFFDINLELKHNMGKIPMVQLVGTNGYGKGGFGMFGARSKYNIPNIVQRVDDNTIKVFATERLHGKPTITQAQPNKYIIEYPNEQNELIAYIY